MIQFIRDLKRDGTKPENGPDLALKAVPSFLWHYMPRLDPETEKPIPTPDGNPDQRPFAWKDLFTGQNQNQDSPIEFEIGSGKGGFLVEYGRKHKDIKLIGSEWDTGCAYYAADRLKRHALENVRLLRGDVYFFLRDLAPENSVDAFHMYFPDPWPKTRQQKNRLLRPDFLPIIAKALKPGKRIFYWGTDHQEYNQIALEVFDGFAGCTVTQRNSAEPTDGVMTSFEKKYRIEGRPIYRSVIVFEK